MRIFITRFGGVLPRSVERVRIQRIAREILFHRGEPRAIAKPVIDNAFRDRREIRALAFRKRDRRSEIREGNLRGSVAAGFRDGEFNNGELSC